MGQQGLGLKGCGISILLQAPVYISGSGTPAVSVSLDSSRAPYCWVYLMLGFSKHQGFRLAVLEGPWCLLSAAIFNLGPGRCLWDRLRGYDPSHPPALQPEQLELLPGFNIAVLHQV